MGVHVGLGATQGDAEMDPPDVSHLVVHWSTAMPARDQSVLWSVGDNPAQEAEAFLAGVARSTSPVQAVEVTYQYAARLEPVPRGANVTYRIAQDGQEGEPRTVRMVPFEVEAIDIAVLAGLGSEGWDPATRQPVPGAELPADAAVARAQALGPDLVLVAGGVARSSVAREWDNAMRLLEPLAAHTPLMAVPGSGESGEDFHQVRERFVFPLVVPGRSVPIPTYTAADGVDDADDRETLYHSFSAGPVYVIGLSTPSLCVPLVDLPSLNEPAVGIPPCAAGQLDMVQLSWLHDTLEDAREDYGATWIVVYLAHGPYAHADDGGDHIVRDHVVPILEDFGVDLVVHGQEAVYERSWPLRDGVPQATGSSHVRAGTGTVYVTAGGAATQGEAMSTPAPGWLAHGAQEPHVVRLQADRATLRLDAFAVADGALLDSFTLHRPGSAGYADASGAQEAPVDAQAQESDALAPLAAMAVAAAVALLRRRSA